MGQYRPEYEIRAISRNSDKKYSEINRCLEPNEIVRAHHAARDAGLWRFDQRWLGCTAPVCLEALAHNNQGGFDIRGLSDVDQRAVARNAQHFPKAKQHNDFRKMLGHELIPESKSRQIGAPPRVLERSPGHYKEWIDACKGGRPAGSNFVDHAARLAEVVLLGNIAIRTNQELLWDGDHLRFTNSEEANKLINPPYREGWSL